MKFLPQSTDIITIEQARQINPLVLAFVGDSVHQLIVRANLTCSHSARAGQLHELATKQVKASAQADAVNRILSTLTEEETDIYKRARNSKTSTIAKNATYATYKKASGYEAVIGYLYLIGANDRLSELLDLAAQGEEECQE